MHDEARRHRRIFIHLRGLCVTDAARDSLEEFRTFWEERQRKIREGEGRSGVKVREKKGWLEGLMGRGKK